MSTTEALSAVDRNAFDDLDYRPVSGAAIASVVLGALSTLVFFAGRDSLQSCLMLCPIPLLGVIFGVRAATLIRRHPDQVSGGKLAATGIALSAICLLGGLSFASFVYATEVPPGYVRTSFAEMRPDEVELRGNVVVPPDVAALDGKKVFIKGYLRPDSTPYKQNIKRFLLVRDNQQCCFGDLGTVNYFDQLDVSMSGASAVDYSQGVYRIGGTLHIAPQNLSHGRPVFSLEADYAK